MESGNKVGNRQMAHGSSALLAVCPLFPGKMNPCTETVRRNVSGSAKLEC